MCAQTNCIFGSIVFSGIGIDENITIRYVFKNVNFKQALGTYCKWLKDVSIRDVLINVNKYPNGFVRMKCYMEKQCAI